jgi:hypothetical protein
VPAHVEGGRWIDLAVTTDPAAGTYRIEMDGQLVAERLPLEHAGPAAGLVTYWGQHEFALFAAAPALGNGQGAAQAGGGAPTPRPVDIAASRDGLVAVLDRSGPLVQLHRGAVLPEGRLQLEPAGSFGAPREGDRPIAIDFGPTGEIHVLDGESGRIDVFREGTAARSIAVTPALEGARGLAVFPDGRLAVAESARGRVAIISASGERLGEIGKKGGGPGEHEAPGDVAIDVEGRVIVADFKGCRVQAFRLGGSGWKLDARSPWLAPPTRVCALPGGKVAVLGRFAYYETGGAVRTLDSRLAPLGFEGAFAAGNLSEEGGLAAIGGTLLCLSRRDARIYAFAGLPEVKPSFTRDGGRTLVRWQPQELLARPREAPRVQIRRDGESDWRDAGTTLDGLEPSAAYEVRFRPQYDFLPLSPGDEGWSRPYRIHGPAPAGKRRVLDLAALCAVYLSHEDVAAKRVVSVERARLGTKLEREFEVARRFFARNSRLRLNIHADFEVIEGTPARVQGGWIDPSQARRDAAPLVAAKGKKLEEYDSVIALWAEPGWRADEPDDPGTVGGGGLTSFAYSTFGIGGRAAWLFAHEFHHQIDAFFNRSGYLEYPLNHPDATVQPGRYGQHWDCNAFFLRSWGDEEWLSCRFGKVLLVDDADGDGVPDRDERLPFDEKRLGSDLAKADTDGDGLDDLAEVMAGTFRGANPRSADSDGDGVSDGADVEALLAGFSTSRGLRAGAVTLDGLLAPGEWQELGTIAEPRARILGRWSREALSFAVESARPLRAHLDVDAAGDGWFLEDDNVSIELDVGRGDASAPPRTQPASARTAGGSAGGRFIAELSLPMSELPRLKGAPARFGLSIRVTYREGEGETARDRELFLGEPWSLLDLALEGTP